MNHLSHKIEGCRPKNTPVFIPPKQPQQVSHLQFVNNTQNTQNQINATSSNNPHNRNNEENNYKITVNSQQPQTYGNTLK